MVLKTFNVEEEAYKRFSDHCKSNGLSMSKQIDFFIRSVIEEEPKAKQEYLEKLERIRVQPKIKVGSLQQLKNRYR
ncbi:hypothetical protein J4460_08255 [Candidatus Woesearchaeota archaeon]|nr:MAG: hypothetical protein QS99_C0012G0046 [archaeon GW2011_AR4]MBS3130631.1 hypothetical protein [Candidatus Woesearchaeota archaeon]HIH39082.1 hypothetical protein [Candidatus Woesearchaeota archaeon]HIH49327.1 hypothetical protein [Candidatus Woesearchaeota archaeon]HIJ03154.1 hypothetical protein [Candidatus Woesearchaeota archaeon]